MAALMLVRDPDPLRRRARLAAAERAMRRFDLEVGSLEHGPIGLAWGAFAGAPIQQAPGVFLMGDVIPGPGPERLTAPAYAARCAGGEAPPAFDGLHLAIKFDANGALTVAADLLGTLPVYVAEAGEALLVATSPALIKAQPDFTAAPDALGIAGLLIANASLRGRTPCRGIRRLGAGRALVAAPGAAPREVTQYAVSPSDESHDVPAEESALRLYEALIAASARHVPAGVPHAMLLSGGLDSRLLAGILVAQGTKLEAITRGDPADIEYRCARTVAAHLGLRQRLLPHTDHAFKQFERAIWWDGMIAGPASGGSEGLGEVMPGAPPWIVSGYACDGTLGGTGMAKSFDRVTRTSSPAHLVRRMNAWGVALDSLPRLLRRDMFEGSVETVLAEIREDHEALAGTFLARTWLYELAHRQRFVMGRMFARLAFGGWPRAPQADREVLRVTGGIPLSLRTGRGVQREMLRSFQPGLARLPLDRNDPDTTPMLANVTDLIRAGIDRRVRRLRERLGVPRPERRYYHREFDFNGEAWRIARRGAEPDRERLYALFERDAVDAMLPPAEVEWRPTGTIEGAAGVKMLAALAVWLRVGFE